MLMSVIAWIIFGAIAGWIASLIAGTSGRQGMVGNIVVGIVGAFVGGLVVRLLGGDGTTGFNLYSLLVAVVGAVILLWIARGFSRGADRA